MYERIEQFQILKPVVELVVVDVMNDKADRNRPVRLLPYQVMLHAEPSAHGVVKTPIAFSGDHVWRF